MQIEHLEHGFRIKIDSRVLLEHRTDKPLFKAGTGTADVKSKSGFYHVAEKNVRMISFSRFVIESESETELSVNFSSPSDSISAVFSMEDRKLRITITEKPESLNRFEIQSPADRTELIFGCGEQYIGRNLRGRRVPLWVSEPGVGRRFDLLTILVARATGHIPRWFNTYYPAPLWVSSGGRWFRSSSKSYAVMDFKSADAHKAYFWEIPSELEFGLEDDTAAALGAMSSSAGRQPRLPEWAYDGLWLGTQGGNETVYNRLCSLRDKGAKICALWCQDWEGRRQTSFGKQLRWAWEYDSKLYPELPEFIKKLGSEGIRFLGYNNTFLTPGSSMFDEAVEKEYLIKNRDGSPSMVDVPFDPAALVDFTNPEARDWLKNIIKENMINIGMSGWMADFGEMIQHDTHTASGDEGLEYHNRYPVDWAQLNREAVEEAGKSDEIIYFMRAGYEGAAASTPLNWTGDQLVGWTKEDGLPSAVAASISLGMSGVGYVHSDIGGYTTLAYAKRSRELLMRWTEFAAFTQVMRSHEGNRPDNNVQFGDDESISLHLAKMTAVYSRLKPYHILLSDEYQNSGLPPVRHIIMHYPEAVTESAAEAGKYNYQYLYGRDLLVAPVLKPNRKTWKVHIPGDSWIHLWSGKKYSGRQTVTVRAELGSPPVFYREDSGMTALFQEISRL